MNPKILSEITGKTHGIKFKIKPPRKPKKRKLRTPRAGTELAGDAAPLSATRQAARSFPLARWAKTTRPLIDDRSFDADSIGIAKLIPFPVRDSIFGSPTPTFPSVNAYKSPPHS